MTTTDMIRPFFKHKPMLEDVTVLICQNKTPDLIRLSLTSLLTFYPTIKVLIVNGTPDDEAGRWCKYQASKHPNVTVWDRVGYDSHGVAMHEATMKIETPYILTLDSDVIVRRGGWLEDMKNDLEYYSYFAIGMLMTPSREGDACGPAINVSDELPYVHPSTCLFDRKIYLDLLKKSGGKSAFTDHGAPSVYTMKYAENFKEEVGGYPVEDYVMHLSGASWTSPRTVWSCDNDVFVRPLVTFISDTYVFQTDKDYDIVSRVGELHKGHYVIHGKEPKEVNNNAFYNRLRVTGDYVCHLELGHFIPTDLVQRLRAMATNNYADVIVIDNLSFYKREYYQNEIAWN